jgi:hypothetical protein
LNINFKLEVVFRAAGARAPPAVRVPDISHSQTRAAEHNVQLPRHFVG